MYSTDLLPRSSKHTTQKHKKNMNERKYIERVRGGEQKLRREREVGPSHRTHLKRGTRHRFLYPSFQLIPLLPVGTFFTIPCQLSLSLSPPPPPPYLWREDIIHTLIPISLSLHSSLSLSSSSLSPPHYIYICSHSFSSIISLSLLFFCLYTCSIPFIIITIMMSFCKRSVHSFLGTLSNTNDIIYKTAPPPPPTFRNIPSPADGLSLIAVTEDHNTQRRITNVLESTIIKPATTTTSSPTITASASASYGGDGHYVSKKDPGGMGFIDEIGGGVDGLMSCTESLGFESSDERRTDEQIMNQEFVIVNNVERESDYRSRKRIKVRSEPKNFPPPLSSLNQNGQPSFYLRPVRKDGRLELTEVRINRPEVLHASRQDGRLRLHLILDDIEEEEEEIEEEEEEEVGEERVIDDEWKLPVTSTGGSGGDGFRRCYELVNHHHHHPNHHSNLHVWSQHCVTTG